MQSAYNMDVVAELRLRCLAENSFYEFVKQAWHLLEGPSVPFIDNWHIQAICEHLEAVYRGDIRYLLYNAPPRTGKSSILGVLWQPWVWTKKPEEQFLFSSYGLKLCQRDLVRSRWVIESQWYQTRFGHMFSLRDDQNTQTKFTNDMNGYRYATSTDASTTGEGANILVMDDPNNAKDGESETTRESTNNYYSSVFSTRGNNPKTMRMVVVQQRFHERDVTGYLQTLDDAKDWVKLILPMEFEVHRRAKTISLPSTNGKIWQDPRKTEGELLWPSLYGPEEVKKGKAKLGSEYRISGQYQQLPSPSEGGIIRKKWFKWWKLEKPPNLIQTIQSWDTAYETSSTACYSACTTWGVFNDEAGIANVILLSLYRDRVGYPVLREMAKRLYKDWRDDGKRDDFKPDRSGDHTPDLVLVEAKASGISLIQDLRAAGIDATRFNPDKLGDKLQRVHLITHLLENGRVWVPAKPPEYTRLLRFSDVLVESCAMFPNGERDTVDTMVQVLHRLKASGMLYNLNDERAEDYGNEREEGFY